MKYLIIILNVFIINKRLPDTIASDFKRDYGRAYSRNTVNSFYISLFYLHSLIRLYNS